MGFKLIPSCSNLSLFLVLCRATIKICQQFSFRRELSPWEVDNPRSCNQERWEKIGRKSHHFLFQNNHAFSRVITQNIQQLCLYQGFLIWSVPEPRRYLYGFQKICELSKKVICKIFYFCVIETDFWVVQSSAFHILLITASPR